MKIENRNIEDVIGTSFYGQTIYATQKQLERLLGKEHVRTHDGKTKCEWKLSIDGVVCCIYDYKTTSSHDINWHIGVRKKEDGEIIKNKIYEYILKTYQDR